MATQEAYVKRVIEIFNLEPADLDATPEIFCDVFGVCQSTTATTLSTTSESTTPSLTTTTTTTTISTTTTTTTKGDLIGEMSIFDKKNNLTFRGHSKTTWT